jgi:hypothetical protein
MMTYCVVSGGTSVPPRPTPSAVGTYPNDHPNEGSRIGDASLGKPAVIGIVGLASQRKESHHKVFLWRRIRQVSCSYSGGQRSSCLDVGTKVPAAHFISDPVSQSVRSINRPTPISTGVTTTNTISCPEPRSPVPVTRSTSRTKVLQQRWHPNSTCDLVSQERNTQAVTSHPPTHARLVAGLLAAPACLVIVTVGGSAVLLLCCALL